MVLFFLLKPIFGGCIALPAPFSSFLQAVPIQPPTNVVTKESQRLQRRSYELRNRIQQ